MKTIYKKQFGGHLYPSVLEINGIDSERRMVEVRVSGETNPRALTGQEHVSANVILDATEARRMVRLLLAWLDGDDNVGAVLPFPRSWPSGGLVPVDEDKKLELVA